MPAQTCGGEKNIPEEEKQNLIKEKKQGSLVYGKEWLSQWHTVSPCLTVIH